MPELPAVLDAFVQEHCGCGELDGGGEGECVVSMTCESGAALAHPWSADGWAEVKDHLLGFIAEERRLRRQGWLN